MASNTTDNIVFSPFSIETCLGLLLQGAEGETLAALMNGLHISGEREDIANEYKRRLTEMQSGSKQPNTMLTIANKVYVLDGYPIKKMFKSVAKNQYSSEVGSIDFTAKNEAAQTINNWIEQQTQGKIKNVISADSLNEFTRMVLVNAVYFKAKWLWEFKTNFNHEREFWVSKTTSKKTTFMSLYSFYLYGAFPEYDAEAVGLQYKESKLIFLILLPNERDGLPKLEAQLDRIDLRAIKQKLKHKSLLLRLPKFKIDGKIDLKDILSKVCAQ